MQLSIFPGLPRGNSLRAQRPAELAGSVTGSDPDSSCQTLISALNRDRTSKYDGEINGFVSGQSLNNNFTANPSSDTCQGQNPGNSNSSNTDLLSWSDTPGTAPDNFTEYDLAILYPLPLLVAV